MRRSKTTIALSGLMVLIVFYQTVFAQDDLSRDKKGPLNEARLRKRITELEAENIALRKILGEIQGALSSIPKSKSTDSKSGKNLRIVVLKDDWGDSQLEDIRKVCLSSAESIWQELEDDGIAPIHVTRSKSGPITLYQRARGHEYQVRLDTANRAWAQCAFQFAHEFGHILCNYRNVPNPQLWFEESICELASLFALRRMGQTWKTKPPYPNWKSYSGALENYASHRLKKYDGRKESLAEFYNQNKSKLFSKGTDRELNGYIAIKLLPLFEKNPTGWQAIRYINLGPKEENQSFESYLRGWHQRVPAKHRSLVQSIADQFGVSIK